MPSYDQGYQQGAKQGTRFLGEDALASWSGLAVDLSQYATDLSDEGFYILEIVGARFDVAAPRTVHARLWIADASEGYVYFHANAVTDSTVLEVVAGGVLAATENGVPIGELQLDVLGDTQEFHVAWVTEVNPDATGAGDAVVSWLLAYNVDTSTAYRAGPFVHAARASDAASTASWGADPAGDVPYSDVVTLLSFHDRAWTIAEIVDTWIAPASAPTAEATIEREPLPLTVDSGIGDRSERQGPPGAWAARSLRQLRRRTATGRSVLLEPLTLSASSPTNNPWMRLAVGSSAYRWHLGHLLALPVPPTCSHLWARVHADLWVTSGAAVPTGIRVYSANRPPVLADPAGAESYVQAWRGDVLTRDDEEPGAGAWSLEVLVPIQRGAEGLRRGWTYIMLAHAFDPEGTSGNDANARLRVNAIQLAPCHVEPEPGGPAQGGESG